MKNPRKQPVQQIVDLPGFDPEECKFETREDFDMYNRWARRNGRVVKVPGADFYKTVKVKFQRFDQPENVLKLRVRNKDIDWQGALKPGRTYDLPTPVVKFINSLSYPKYAEVKVQDGGETVTETQVVGEISRFSCQVVEFGD